MNEVQKIDFLVKHYRLIEYTKDFLNCTTPMQKKSSMNDLLTSDEFSSFISEVGPFKIEMKKKHKPNSTAKVTFDLSKDIIDFIKQSRFLSGKKMKTIDVMKYSLTVSNGNFYQVWTQMTTLLSTTYALAKPVENEKMRWLLEVLNSTK